MAVVCAPIQNSLDGYRSLPCRQGEDERCAGETVSRCQARTGIRYINKSASQNCRGKGISQQPCGCQIGARLPCGPYARRGIRTYTDGETIWF